MNGRGKSDRPVVAGKLANKDVGAPTSAESVEPRGLAKGNAEDGHRHRTQRRARLQQAVDRVRQAARRDKTTKFTSLWHHVYDQDRLREAYLGLRRNAAAGVDRVTWETYGRDLEANLQDLSNRLARGAYRAKPVRRVHIPKADGRQRPIGIPTLEDKIVQRATTQVLNAIYEEDFLGFSYGFRPGRGQHDALDALAVAIEKRKVNWVLDADIRGFFDTIDHGWLVRFIEHRIGDQRVVRHIKKWLNAGVLEEGETKRVSEGTPQGGSISPLLANVYLHYVLDLWVHQWRTRHASGDLVIVRFADDFVVGFQRKDEAERFKEDLGARLREFKLELHPEKTRLLEFGRFAAKDRKKRGEGKPETFDFLGFTHLCGKTRNGHYALERWTAKDRMRRKLRHIRTELRRRLHWNPHEVGRWLRAVLRGHAQYYGVPRNGRRLRAFAFAMHRIWYWALNRRSQRSRLTWVKARRRFLGRYLFYPKICHPWPSERFARRTRGRSPVR